MNNIINSCPLFAGISKDETELLLKELDSKQSSYKKGDTIVSPHKHLNYVGIVTDGKLRTSRNDINGNAIIINFMTPGDIFGQALANSELSSDIYVTADTDTKVMWLNIKDMYSCKSYSVKFLHNYINALSDKILQFNTRINILSKKTIKERVLTYLMTQVGANNKAVLNINRNDMADFLGVERSALSRELSNMQKAGIINYNKNVFTLNSFFDK